jgi:hypothetical protein
MKSPARLFTVWSLGIGCAVLISGCATGGRRTEVFKNIQGIRAGARPEVLRSSLTEYLIQFSASVEQTADRIACGTEDACIRRSALLWKLNAIPAMRQACFRQEPLGGVLDAWTLAAQMKAFFDSEKGREAFGPYQDDVVSVSAKLLADARALWASVSRSEADVEEWERTEITPWVEAHLLTDLSFARTSGIAKFAELIRERGGAVQTLMSTEEQVEILSEETRIYLANAHKQARGEAELVLGDLIRPDQTDNLVSSVKLLSAAADRAATFAERTPALVATERGEILDAIDRQRRLLMHDVHGEQTEISAMIAAERETVLRAVTEERVEVMKAISAERVAALEGIGSERTAILAGVNDQRLETLSWLDSEITCQRTALVGDVERIVQASLNHVDREMEKLVDKIMLRLIGLIVASVVATPIIAHAYVRVWPRSVRAS